MGLKMLANDLDELISYLLITADPFLPRSLLDLVMIIDIRCLFFISDAYYLHLARRLLLLFFFSAQQRLHGAEGRAGEGGLHHRRADGTAGQIRDRGERGTSFCVICLRAISRQIRDRGGRCTEF